VENFHCLSASLLRNFDATAKGSTGKLKVQSWFEIPRAIKRT